MTQRIRRVTLYGVCGLACLFALWLVIPNSLSADEKADQRKLAKAMLDSLGAKAGLCVHLGVQDGNLTTDLSGDGQYLVHGLCTSQESVERARKTIDSAGMSGVVSVELGSVKRLPYADRLVNLIVADDYPGLVKQGLTIDELLRVLRPGGVAWLGKGDDGEPSLKELTKKLVDARIEFDVTDRSGGWVKLAKPRSELMDQWTHRFRDSTGNAVSKDKIVGLPSGVRWVAGPNWPTGYRKSAVPGRVASEDRLVYIFQDEEQTMDGPQPQDSLIARDAYNGLLLWKRKTTTKSTALVSVGDRVFTVLEDDGQLVALDAGTGEIVHRFKDVICPQQIAYVDGSLLVDLPDGLGCYDATSGKLNWKYPHRPAQFLAGDGRVFVHSDSRAKSGQRESQLASLDLTTGKPMWSAPTKNWTKSTPTLVLYQDDLLVAAADGNHGISAKDGSHLWNYRYPKIGHGGSFSKVMYMNDLVWVHTAAFDETKRYAWEGLDPRTGEVETRVIQPADYRYKHRCAYDVATERYFMCGSMDFADLKTGKYTHFSAARMSCARAGLMPANGLIYTFPHACGCYAMLRGFIGLATDDVPESVIPESASERLEKGPIYGKMIALTKSTNVDWPTYRRDTYRSGSTQAPGPATLQKLWDAAVSNPVPDTLAAEWDLKNGGRLSAPVAANGLAIAAANDEHRVVAFDAGMGKQEWNYLAGGRVDCPPTIHEGLCLFGSRDGWIYCLRADDGGLVWRFRAAPDDRRIVAYGQLESAWPVVGGVLVYDGLAYCVVGRHGGSDGGVFVYALEPKTGRLVWAERPEKYPGVPDVLNGADGSVQMASWSFDAKTGTNKDASQSRLRGGSLGLLNNAWYKRPIAMRKNLQLWSAGGDKSGQMISFSKSATCGFRACNRVSGGNGKMSGDATLFAIPENGKSGDRWSINLPNTTRLRGMAIADKRVYVAGRFATGDALWNAVRCYALADGKLLDEYAVDSPLIHDGLAVAGDRLYVSTQGGKLICLGGK